MYMYVVHVVMAKFLILEVPVEVDVSNCLAESRQQKKKLPRGLHLLQCLPHGRRRVYLASAEVCPYLTTFRESLHVS